MPAIEVSQTAKDLISNFGKAMYELAQCGGTLADLEAPVDKLGSARFSLYAYIAELEASAQRKGKE